MEKTNIYRIKEIAKAKGIALGDLALSVGVTRQSISNISNGTQQPAPDLLLKIAKALDTNLPDLLIDTKPDEASEGIYINTGNTFKKIGTIKKGALKNLGEGKEG